mmetsp:Transcript_9197/g.19303  ORF Transcript_9197/g.19303 Transcript_9197/m.19303 type:complete len:211 (+) Transcript_9197:604-1236(+)
MLFDDRSVGLDDRVQAFFGEGEVLVGFLVVLVVKEDTSQSTGFVSVLDDEVTVGPRFEFFVVFRIVLVADFLVGSVEVLHVVFVDVTGGDIGTSTEPPDTSVGFEVSVVEVHGWAMRVFGVHDTAQSACEERNALTGGHSLGAVDSTFCGSLKGFLRHASVNDTEVDSGLFENLSSGHDTRHTATSVGSGPGILTEFGITVDFFDGLRDL